ncbi:hypothetical protein L596_024007 [Steinernema carpocapsae]|uniref:Uncharacterized protein n=1 Tax=Steinernema carpocapsae TaxID=34508 RepID=A0A4U5MFD6_STECR|nr:hypothetical protein L596_024007 [Steinernema carpocapsae]
MVSAQDLPSGAATHHRSKDSGLKEEKLVDCDQYPNQEAPKDAKDFCVRVTNPKKPSESVAFCGIFPWIEGLPEEMKVFRCNEPGHSNIVFNHFKADKFCCKDDGCNVSHKNSLLEYLGFIAYVL